MSTHHKSKCSGYRGGWILVYVANTNSVTNTTSITNSNVNNCLLSGNYATTCTQQSWQSVQINASSYMKKNGNGDKIIVVFNTSMSWLSLGFITPTSSNFKYSYVANNPTVHYLGYGIDTSSAVGCQDSATLSNSYYPFAIGLSNIPCGDTGTKSIFFSMPDALGTFINGSWYYKEGIFVR